MQKPPVDIEWYDDGFSMEEQKELAKEYSRQKTANRVKIKVTESYHENKKDEIISDLRQKLAADEEYIAELESDINNSKLVIVLKEDLELERQKKEELKKQYAVLNQKYADVLNSPELGVQKYRDTIKDLEKQVKTLQAVRDNLIYKLNACLQ